MKISLLTLGAVLLLGGPTPDTKKPVTFWVSSSTPLDITNVKVTTIGKLPVKMKLGKSCAGTSGKFQIWQALSIDVRGNLDAEQVEIVANGIPANAETLASLRVEGTCTESGKTWTKYSGILEVPKPARASAKPAKPAATPKPTPK